MQTFPSPQIYDALDYIMGHYPDKFTEQARVEIDIFLDHCIEDLGNNSEKFLSTLMIKALKHLTGSFENDGHIYLNRYEIPQIELFNVLIKEFPFVKWGHHFSNELLFSKLKNSKQAVIVDVGMGQGIQMQNLLIRLNDAKELKEVVIIGIEPFADAIETATKLIENIAPDLNYKIELVPVNRFIQDMDEQALNEIVSNYSGDIMISSSLTLHHIQTLEERLDVIKMLRSVNPMGIVLIEPNIDHFEPDFKRRFQNCFQHFYHIFQVIDNLSVDSKAKNGLKLFFGREIEDIMGKKNEDRYEKHEPAFRWIEKLNNCGFIVRNNFLDDLVDIGNGIETSFIDEGFLGFTYKAETVLSIIYAESNLRN